MFFNYKNNYNMNGTLSTSTIKTDTLPVRQGTLPMANTLVRQDIVKSHIIQQIENLKTDIQNLLDKKKFISNDEMGDWTINKNEKMSQLKILTEKLKEINKKERSELRMNNERNKLYKKIDNLEYGAAKKKNNHIAMDKAKREKELRNEKPFESEMIGMNGYGYNSNIRIIPKTVDNLRTSNNPKITY